MRRKRRRFPRVTVAVLALAALTIAAFREGLLPTRPIAALFPVDLNVPDAYFLDWRLAALKGDRELCRRVVKPPLVATSEIDDAQPVDGCGWRNGVRLASIAGVRLPVDKLTCELTAALALWITHDVQPRAQTILGEPVTAIEHMGGYACRNIRGSPAFSNWRSQHAGANALDVSAFVLSKGRRIAVQKHWGAETPEGQFLREIHQRSCRYFRVAIGPDYNAAHRDHFHYDRGTFSACR